MLASLRNYDKTESISGFNDNIPGDLGSKDLELSPQQNFIDTYNPQDKNLDLNDNVFNQNLYDMHNFDNENKQFDEILRANDSKV